MDFYLERVEQAISRATQGMAIAQLSRRPQEGKWSAAEILEHLSLTYSGTAKAMERCLTAGQPTANLPTLKDRVATVVVVGLGHMPQGREAPAVTRPRGAAPEESLPVLLRSLAEMDELITRCEQKFGKRRRIVNHPVLGPLTARQWRKFLWVHARHHAQQIERLHPVLL